MRLFDDKEDHDHSHADDAHSQGEDHAAPGHVDDGHDGHDSHAGHAHDPMDPNHLFGHVQDADHFHVPKFLGEHWHLPDFRDAKETPLVGTAGFPIVRGLVTKFMVLELVGALVLIVTFVWLASKVKTGARPKGKIWNFLETFVVFIRDEIARPTIGKADADRFLPFLLTTFFFILILNLFGMIPWMGSATGALAVTAVLALVTFVVVVGTGMKKMGVVGFAKAQVPHMDLPKPLAVILIPSIWAIEIFGLFVKHFVLAIRLFANMFAGHLVLAVFLGFIAMTAGSVLYYFVGPAVVLGSVAIGLLELFVAFLQAYVFTFLASLFIGAAVHPH